MRLVENCSSARSRIRAISGVFVVVLVLGIVLSIMQGFPLAPWFIYAIVTLVWIVRCEYLFFWRKKRKLTLTNDGIVFSDDFKKHGMISWGQIAKIVPCSTGLILQWRSEVRPMGRSQQEPLFVNDNDAQLIISLWAKAKGNCDAAKAEPHSRGYVFSKRGWPVPTILVIFGSVLLVLALLEIVREIKSNSWSSTDGQIISAQYEKVGGKHARRIEGKIVYEYVIDNQKMRSDRFSLWSKHYRKDVSESNPTSGPFTNNMPVRVYYDPSNPRNAALALGVNWAFDLPWILLSVGIISLGLRVLRSGRTNRLNGTSH